MPHSVLPAYGLEKETLQLETFGNGLINHTWKVTTPRTAYILQRINDAVFKKPDDIAYNINLIAAYLKANHPGYKFVAPLASHGGKEMIYQEDEGFFRLFPFVTGSHSVDVAETPGQAFEAASQFGKFTRLLCGLDVSRLRITLPSFHNISYRYQQFTNALANGNQQRIAEVREEVAFIKAHASIVGGYDLIQKSPDFKLRVTHHDTKISNVLFNTAGEGICIIDLDTVMPGYFISDVGDMMRTYLSPVSEEETDLSKIEVREEFYKAITDGYCSHMRDELSVAEKQMFFYSGKFMIYMQALRFLADYINNDVYYGSAYEGHNLVRARNQIVLLQRLMQKEPVLINCL